MVSLLQAIKKPFKERAIKKEGMMTGTPDPITPKEAFKRAFEEEKKQIEKEKEVERQAKEQAKIKRAEERAKRAARNPLLKRLAKKAGAIGKKSIDATAAKIGEELKKL